jgi:hypothetical protein
VRNRRSAEARARWLTSVHKNKTTVVSDGEITAEQKKGNLLILGWNNRAFGSPAPTRPFTHGPTGTKFFGIVEPDPKVDLLVFHRNPLDWDHCVLFWTRIDPERSGVVCTVNIGAGRAGRESKLCANLHAELEVETREFDSILRLQSGESAVLAGLMQDTVENTDTGIPGLRNIPLIGEALSQRTDLTRKTELVIFLRATVIRDASLDGDFRSFRDQVPSEDFFRKPNPQRVAPPVLPGQSRP